MLLPLVCIAKSHINLVWC